MSTPTAVAERGQRNRVTIYGRIESIKNTTDGTFTTVALPAQDEFSGVQYAMLRSGRSLGQRGEVIERDCTVGGYRTRFEFTDKKTGVVQQGEKVAGHFVVIE